MFCRLVVLILFLVSFCFYSIAQNLVPNPSFESYSQIPTMISQWEYCDNWSSVLNSGPYQTTADYLHLQGILSYLTLGSATPRTGNAIMGIATYLTFYLGAPYEAREYITVKLPSKPVKGVYYDISYWVTNGTPPYSQIGRSSNNLGFHLSKNQMIQNGDAAFDITPTYHEILEIWTPNAWKQLSHSLRINADFNYLTIGNFHSDANTISNIYANTSVGKGAYYFIDDVEMIPTYPFDTVRICMGDSILLPVSNDPAYMWVKDTFPRSIIANNATIFVSPTTTTTYMKITPSDTSLYIVSVGGGTQKKPNLGSDTVICNGQTITLNASNDSSIYRWQDGSRTSFYQVRESGEYWVEAINQYCSKRDTIVIQINLCPLETLEIPNIITPNGDDYNEYFIIPENDVFEYGLEIYNRWGKQVYQSEDYEDSWNAEGLKDGSYFYKLVYEKEEFSGWVEVVR